MYEDTSHLHTLITLVQTKPQDDNLTKLILDCVAQQLNADVLHVDHNSDMIAACYGWNDQIEELDQAQLASLNKLIPHRELLPVDQGHIMQQAMAGWGSELLHILYIPLMVHGQRLGGIFTIRGEAYPYQPHDVLFAQMASLLYAMQRTSQIQADTSAQRRMADMARQAIGTLSYSELQAVDVILGELDGNEGVLVASRIADREQITRSVIVNALRKVESAGLIETRSLGMKGTYIRILNKKLIEELKYL